MTILVAPDSDKFATLGAAASGISVPSQWEPQVQYKPVFGPTVAQFTAQYRARFNEDPDYHAATGYAEGLLLQHAIEQAGSIDRDKVTAELNKIDTTTFFGRTKFATEPRAMGCSSPTTWCSRSGRPRTASSPRRWSGRMRRPQPRSSTRCH